MKTGKNFPQAKIISHKKSKQWKKPSIIIFSGGQKKPFLIIFRPAEKALLAPTTRHWLINSGLCKNRICQNLAKNGNLFSYRHYHTILFIGFLFCNLENHAIFFKQIFVVGKISFSQCVASADTAKTNQSTSRQKKKGYKTNINTLFMNTNNQAKLLHWSGFMAVSPGASPTCVCALPRAEGARV